MVTRLTVRLGIVLQFVMAVNAAMMVAVAPVVPARLQLQFAPIPACAKSLASPNVMVASAGMMGVGVPAALALRPLPFVGIPASAK